MEPGARVELVEGFLVGGTGYTMRVDAVDQATGMLTLRAAHPPIVHALPHHVRLLPERTRPVLG